MTDQQRQAANQALEALEGELWLMLDKPEDEQYRVKYAYLLTVITALRTALAAQPQPQDEPVAYLCENGVGHRYFRWKKPSDIYKPIGLYTAPPQREWQGLTDNDWEQIHDKKDTALDTFQQGAVWAESQLMRRNK